MPRNEATVGHLTSEFHRVISGAVYSRPMRDSLLAGRIIWPLISLSGCGSIALRLAEKKTTRLPLLLTFVAGPLGLLYFLLQRGLRRPMPYPFDQPRAKKSGRHRQ